MQTVSLPFPHIAGPAWPGVHMLATTRAGGVSSPPFATLNLGDHVGDAPQSVARNRRVVQEALPGEPCWLSQVHGIDVHDADLDIGDAHSPRADAAVTAVPRRVLAILTADCLPVVIASRDGKALGLAHAGWRGLAAGVLERTVAQVRARASDTCALQAWIGPAIGPAAFEVGEDVVEGFGLDELPGAFVPRAGVPGKWWCNLPLIAQHRLQAAGIGDVAQSGACTLSDERFFSYRRDGRTGRFATFAWLAG